MKKANKNLFDICDEFIDAHNLRSPECVYQNDIDHEDICELLIKVCDIVGYFEDEEE